MRPRSLSEFVGQQHILAPGKPLWEAIQNQALHSMILWGPPGVGKTTLARLLANQSESHFESLSAVLAGVKEIREAVGIALQYRAQGKKTVLFIDEVHRFNKSQQDAFLPHIENGTILFVGATTENPAFELNNALLSRARTYVLKSLQIADLEQLITATLLDQERGLGRMSITMSKDAVTILASIADGDARRALNLLEIAADFASNEKGQDINIDETVIAAVSQESLRRFDKGADIFYEQISALHKSVRGSDPDASLYWLTRMLDGGCDPLYIARRLLRIASEDIGNADPRAIQLALNGWETYTRLGSPEGELALAQVVLYLASAPKSNAVYAAFNSANQLVQETGSLEVPLHLRNAPTNLARELGYGKDYRYAHDEEGGYAAGESYFPPELNGKRFYYPADRGLEQKIGAKLEHLRSLDQNSRSLKKDSDSLTKK
ncbi:MAG: replication-associated recombination protein A [Pseudohongiellaceae bacterium]